MAAQETYASTLETGSLSTKISRQKTPSTKTRNRETESAQSQPIRRDLLKTKDKTMPKKRDPVRVDSIVKNLAEK